MRGHAINRPRLHLVQPPPRDLASIEAAIAEVNALPRGRRKWRAVLALCDAFRELTPVERLLLKADAAETDETDAARGAPRSRRQPRQPK